jgi:transposase
MKKSSELKLKILRILKKLNYPEFLHRFGPKKYKLVDHLSGILVMQICQTSLRRTEIVIKLFGQKCPTYSALCKSRKRLPLELWQKLLTITAGLASKEVAIDGTGFGKTNPSFHYLKRINSKNPKDFAKLSALLDLKTKKFLVMKIRITPRHDMQDVKYLIKRIKDLKVLCADKGYSAEWLYEECFWKGIQTFIPSKKNVKRGHFRKKQMKKWDQDKYNLRSNIEAGFSAIKRKYGANIKAKKMKGINTEILCKGIVHNLGLG